MSVWHILNNIPVYPQNFTLQGLPSQRRCENKLPSILCNDVMVNVSQLASQMSKNSQFVAFANFCVANSSTLPISSYQLFKTWPIESSKLNSQLSQADLSQFWHTTAQACNLDSIIRDTCMQQALKKEKRNMRKREPHRLTFCNVAEEASWWNVKDMVVLVSSSSVSTMSRYVCFHCSGCGATLRADLRYVWALFLTSEPPTHREALWTSLYSLINLFLLWLNRVDSLICK